MSESFFPLVTKHFFIRPESEEKIWDKEWTICDKEDENKQIGKLHFEEAGFHGEVKLFVDLDTAFDGVENTAEIFYAMSRFVFMSDELREISTDCHYEDDHRVRGLEKAGYVMRRLQDGRYYYSITKQKSAWTGFYVIIGMVAGFMIGILISNLWVGTVAGVLIGSIIGFLLDRKEKKDK